MRADASGEETLRDDGRSAIGRLLPAVLVAALPWVSTLQARALECPVAHMTNGPASLKETPATIDHIDAILAKGGATAAPDVIAVVRSRHPQARNGEIMNFLVTAYCPVVAKRSDLSEPEKRRELLDFNREVEKVFYRK